MYINTVLLLLLSRRQAAVFKVLFRIQRHLWLRLRLSEQVCFEVFKGVYSMTISNVRW